MKIKPRILPRNILDILIGVPILVYGVVVVYLLPVFMVLLIFDSVICAIILFLLIWGYFVFGGVRYLVVDENGILFKRIIGNPKYIAWENLENVELSKPLNTVLKGWIWPLTPPREMTFSLSAHGHFEFEYNGGKIVFFPPKSENELLNVIQEHKPQVLTRGSSGRLAKEE